MFLQRVSCFWMENVLSDILKKRHEFYGVDGKDADGIVSQLRLTAGVEVAMFIYEVETQSFKVSLRSNGNVDVSKIAVYFGGGGHMRAAGCDLQGSVYDVIDNVTEQMHQTVSGAGSLMDGVIVIRKEKDSLPMMWWQSFGESFI